ncbi:TrmH family RNA methyltransferase [Gordonia insulae]|uniref:23S rRNA (Uridine(2479)-2'-O)-methyltransferase n=1 Tax=Gordonia insulae TaxID=2420509 RepID=A0A3G8JFC2_9ACTN|nr:RNA methyltransferase [Gordonia insulae]AZG43861.1 23S rRNA (uridine(2479)-2'-O)-methyltransferase [Gordonia insulae]
MTEILSERSSRVVSFAKLHRASVRRSEGRFLVEGANSVTSALAVGRAEVVLVPEDESSRHQQIVEAAESQGVPVFALTPRAAAKLAETDTPTGVFAICPLIDVPLAEVLAASPQLLAVAVEPREPGNVGTLIRCADAMGADGLVLLGDAVDPHNGKSVRASAGSVFHLPIARERSISAGLDAIRQAGIATLATAADGELSLDDADKILAGRCAWLFGNEAHGLADDVLHTADHRVSIPIRGRAESLNLAAAAAICLYANARVHATSGR